MRRGAIVVAGLAVVAAVTLAAVTLAACSSFGAASDGTNALSDAEAEACGDACGVVDASSADAARADARESVTSVHAGGQFACAIRSSGAVSCWGRNNEGQVGQPPEGDLACDDQSRCRPTPIVVPGLANVTHLAGGQLFACARTTDGAVLCWGSNDFGVLGKTGPSRPTPAVVSALPPAIDVSAGSFNACARVQEDGGVEVYCWGTNREGMLGATASATVAGPTRIAALAGARSVVLSRASEHGCAILADNSVVCWGNSFSGALGHVTGFNGDLVGCPGGGSCNHVPGVVGTAFQATELALGLSFGCARLVGTGDVACWGYNAVGSCGLGGVSDTESHPVPGLVAGTTGATAITAGGLQACALVAGKVMCWGGNGLGELGNGNASDSCFLGACKTSPQPVLNLKGAARISAGFNSSFASTADGVELSWGGNPDGRLGHAPGTSNDLLKCTANTGRCNPLPQAFVIP